MHLLLHVSCYHGLVGCATKLTWIIHSSTTGDKIVEALSVNAATSEKKRIHPLPLPLNSKLGCWKNTRNAINGSVSTSFEANYSYINGLKDIVPLLLQIVHLLQILQPFQPTPQCCVALLYPFSAMQMPTRMPTCTNSIITIILLVTAAQAYSMSLLRQTECTPVFLSTTLAQDTMLLLASLQLVNGFNFVQYWIS